MEGRSTLIIFRPYCVFQSEPVLFGGRSRPDSDGSAQDRLGDGRVEVDQQGLVKLPELSHEVQPLLHLHTNSVYI